MSEDKPYSSFDVPKEEKKSKSKVKVGDKKDGYEVLAVLEDGRLCVSSATEAKVIKASEF